jgi:hypothetical protein
MPGSFLVEMGSNFVPGMASNQDPPIFIYHEAGITGMSHHAWLYVA